MHGIISDAGGGAYQALCVDMHTGDPLDIEAGNGVMRVYLPQKSCGNAVLRLFANLQRFFDSGATCERLGWD